MKQCRKCLQVLPYSCFYSGAKYRDGKKNICKDCSCKQVKERRDSLSEEEKEELSDSILAWKEENPDSVKEHAKRWRDKVKVKD